jgi:diguanylate cyclase (GGDEF)-like protein
MSLSWRTRSLRFWLTFGLLLAILPMAASAVIGHVVVNRGVIGRFADVAVRQRDQLLPIHRLRALILDASVPVDEFVDLGDAMQPPVYRAVRERIEAAFAELHGHLAGEAEPLALVERAREDWAGADHIATEILSVRRPPGDPHEAELMQRFDGLIESASDKLSAVSVDIERDLTDDHDAALRAFERTDWVIGIAWAVSLLTVLAAVLTIGRIVSTSVDRLVIGAERFASGDRAHRIDVVVPPELHSVAEEFNRMIVRIHESEAALSELARRDGLTKLLNRRAFDHALADAIARRDRSGVSAALLMIDLDHFKRINDTYGHGIGDDVLNAVARTLTSDVRLVDHVFRIGGEEFGVLLFGADADGAVATAERLRREVEGAPVTTSKGVVAVTISIGMAPLTGPDPAGIVSTADAALYRAKQAGRNRVVSSLDGA